VTNYQHSDILLVTTSINFSGENDDVFITSWATGTQNSTVMIIDNSNTNNITLLKNGTTFGPVATTGAGGANNLNLALSNYQFGIGRKMSTGSEYFTGTMKSVMVFNTALSASDAAIIDAWQQSI
jgi:hypothetical protein